MENVPFTSIEEVDDISSHDEYKVALEAGLSPEEALKAVSRFSRDNARTPCSGPVRPMRDLLRVRRG